MIKCSSFVFVGLLLTTALLLSGCGGGSSSSNSNDINNDLDRPVFSPHNLSISPSYSPTGNITDTTPTFSWKAINNATEYHVGHHDSQDENTWRSYKVLAVNANCPNAEDNCVNTPTDPVFSVGGQRVWWVRAKIGGNWAEWSAPHIFTIIDNSTTIGVPEAIAPTGEITDTTPEFLWSAVSNASEYQFGHEGTARNWHQYNILKEQAGCLNNSQTCAFTPGNHTFVVGDQIEWWVRAKVNGDWGEWSTASPFIVIQQPPTTRLIPEQIAPSGDITSIRPQFSWTAVTNATEYRLGHEETNTEVNWNEYTISPANAGCQSTNQNCIYTLPVNTFNVGDNISWWVRAEVAGNLEEWSTGKNFTVLEAPVPLEIKINEVLAANTQTNLDPDFFEFSDWLELYNPSNQNIDISNYGLSDDENPLQWRFPAGTIINANSYLLVWADGEDTNENALHSNFKLSSKGEKLTLADNTGAIIDSIDFKKQNSDISSTVQNAEIVFMSPTPGAQNTTIHDSKDRSKAPGFSFDSGFFENPIVLSLTQENSAEIFYTIDGSIPNQDTTKFIQPINITETMVVRAAALEANGLLSEIISRTYFINHTSTLPVVSLTTDPNYLFDPKIGIYTDGDGTNGIPLNQCSSTFTVPKNYAHDWERPVHLEYFGTNRQSEFLLATGISISGQCSRQTEKKSFSFEMDSKFGFKSLKYKLFDQKNIDKFKDFILRTGESGFEVSDILAVAVVQDGILNIDYQAFRTAQMFVNGDYWGLYNFREKKGKDFITANYPDIDDDELDIINQGFKAKTGDTDDYFALEVLLHDLNLDLSNDADYQQIISIIDENNYIDYMALMIYSANSDWISSNQRSWKEKKAGAKWRWMLDDVDAGFHINNINLDQFSILIQSDITDVMVSLFKGLTKNSTFKQKFKTRFTALLDTTFSSANMINVIDTIIDERKDFIPLETPVWNSITTAKFNQHVQSIKDFVNARDAVVRNQLNSFIP